MRGGGKINEGIVSRLVSDYALELEKSKLGAYSDYHAGILEGLSRAKSAWEENVKRFLMPECADVAIWRFGCLGVFSGLIEARKEPGDSCDDYVFGVNYGLTLAMEAFNRLLDGKIRR